MAELPRSLPEFEARFPDDAACARWLLEKRWPDGFRCPACGHTKGWELGRERLTLQCAACERQVSVTAGTVLHGSQGWVQDTCKKWSQASRRPSTALRPARLTLLDARAPQLPL